MNVVKLQNKREAMKYYKDSLITKSLESLRWNAQQKINYKNIIMYMNARRDKINLKIYF